MKFIRYIKDRIIDIIMLIIVEILISMIFFAFKVPRDVKVSVSIVIVVAFLIPFTFNYLKKKSFYDKLEQNLKNLDKKYLVLETISKPTFYEGDILYKTMYEVDKSMIENLNVYKHNISDFKEYIEMWIHEVKIPIATLTLMSHNNRETLDKKYIEQIQRLDDYTDQVLYYVRSENAEKDYLIKETNLLNVIGKVAMKNKDYLLENNINLDVNNVDYVVYTDSKWLEFILNQIINNSIKYKKESDSFIKIYAEETKDKIILNIYDNGIGIASEDIPRVFQKSFTGYNGRIRSKSTGMGLYIANQLSSKLGHKIEIESVQGKYTDVKLSFSCNDYYKFSD